jgi:hypothetical protein
LVLATAALPNKKGPLGGGAGFGSFSYWPMRRSIGVTGSAAVSRPYFRSPDQARLLDRARAPGAEYCGELERGADRPAADRSLRRQGRRVQPRRNALGGLVPFWTKDIEVGFANINAIPA